MRLNADEHGLAGAIDHPAPSDAGPRSARSKAVSLAAPQLGAGPLIRRLRRIALDIYDDLARNLPVSAAGSLLLRVLAKGRCDSDRLRELVALDPVSFAKEIGALRRDDLVAVHVPPVDRRRRMYALTKAGKAMVTRLRRVMDGVEQSFLSGLSERDRLQFMRIFTKLVLAHSANGTIKQNPAVIDVLDGRLDPVMLMRRARQISVELFAIECGALDITAIESGAINLICSFRAIAAKDLPKLLGVNRGSAFAVTAKLLEAGLLSPQEHAQRRLVLSPAGLSFQKDLSRRIERVNANMMRMLARDEQASLKRLMQRIYETRR